MRKKTYSKINGNHIAISLTIFSLLTISIFTFSNVVLAQEKGLQILRDERVVKVDEEFTVRVVNETGKPVEDATVYIADTNLPVSPTNDDGYAILLAPSESGNYVIVAEKDGYKDTVEIKVVSSPGFWESPFFPIIVATICLISAIVYVNLRQKKDVYNRTKEISKEKLMKMQETTGKIASSRYGKKKETKVEAKFETKSYELKPVRSKITKDAKVEEIRISRPRKQKEVIPVDAKKDETEKVISEKRMKRRDYDWFEGTDDVRYEIDKLTGEIDEEGIDKWFEGVDDLRNKIDERMKKKDKKKKEEKEE